MQKKTCRKMARHLQTNTNKRCFEHSKQPKHALFEFTKHVLLFFSDVRGPFRTNNPQHIPQNISCENCSHFWKTFRFVCRNMLKQIIGVCSHIQKNTQNPNPIFKKTIYYKIHQKRQKHFRQIYIFEVF